MTGDEGLQAWDGDDGWLTTRHVASRNVEQTFEFIRRQRSIFGVVRTGHEES